MDTTSVLRFSEIQMVVFNYLKQNKLENFLGKSTVLKGLLSIGTCGWLYLSFCSFLVVYHRKGERQTLAMISVSILL